MTLIRGTLFCLGAEPIAVEMNIDPSTPIIEQWPKITITAGDDVGAGTVILPLAALTGVVSALMEADKKRQSKITMPNKDIILPN